MLSLECVTKRFGKVRAVDDVSLAVEEGEFFSLLGPSGCGKTTLLRTIAGIYDAESGRISLKGADLSGKPMHARDIALVFQNNALFPHLTIFENVAFGLVMRKVPRAEIAARVSEALALVRMQGYESRKPSELSGGQQQRIALARAVVVRPSLLLLDEPLSNLDAKLRDEMREEIHALQRQLGITTVLVTHDLREAFAVSDRVAVMRSGGVEQVGTPAEIYDEPASHFVAGFVGHQNIFQGMTQEAGGGAVSIAGDDGLAWRAPARGKSWTVGDRAWGTIRPERIRVGEGPHAAEVEDAAYLGGSVELRLRVGNTRLRAHSPNLGQPIPKPGDAVRVGWREEDVIAAPERLP
jgi:ABC-type Fe3+/spermidine/putrescine transport system ATPase subunit